MRCGYASRGTVYVIVGALAFVAAVDGGSTPDSKSALGSLLQMPFGKALLALIALGLVAYSLWCFIDAGLDLDNKGTDAKGWAARVARIISGAVHLALAFSATALAMGTESPSGGGDSGGPALSGRVNSRSDVVRAIDAIVDYYSRQEPGSPIPVVLGRVRGWVNMDFLSILNDISPSSIDDAKRVLTTRTEDY